MVERKLTDKNRFKVGMGFKWLWENWKAYQLSGVFEWKAMCESEIRGY